jgi:pimeloyl-ACP methyl ester carboxylesterase
MNSSERRSNSSSGDLLLLPGLMCDQVFWQPLIDALPPTLNGQVVDYGDADSLGAMAQAALAVAPARFALAGHSMGGRVAMELVRLAPQRVERLVLMDTGYRPLAPGEAGEQERAGRMALVELARRDGVRTMAEEWTKGMVHPSRLGDAMLVGQIIDMFAHKSAHLFANQQQALLNRADATPVLTSLAGLGLPTLLLCGRQDSWANLAQHEAMLGLAPQASLCVIEDAGHMVLMEQPAATRQALLSFLLSPSR